MKSLAIGTLFILASIALAPFDVVSAIICLVGACICVIALWFELS